MPLPDIPAPRTFFAKMVVVFFGMTASGKSTLGQAWAASHQAPYHNTDRVRKELAGLQAVDKRPDGVGQGIYTQAFTAQTYRALLDRADGNFAAGANMVVLDGSYGKREDREQVRRFAAESGARCVFVLCTCGEEEVRRRLKMRALDPTAVSDGRWEIYLHQVQSFEFPDEAGETDCIRIDTEQPVPVLLQRLAMALARSGQALAR